ncbi:MAG: class I SAM-dependent methyltransferase [archaeon]|jgi:hypothetical protein|nr:class I SAM-dependent methyltransferase [archaeon]
MKKKGLSNIEFMLAFILFAVFVMAAFYLFNPIKSTRVLESSKNYVVGQVTAEATVQIRAYSVKLETTGSCSGSVFEIAVPGIGSGEKARVEDYYGNAMPSKKSGERVIFDRGSSNFAVLKFSEDFEAGILDKASDVNKESCYTIASSYTDDSLSEKKIMEMNKSYYVNYEGLKDKLNIPNNINFGFMLEFDSGKVILADKSSPLRVEVFSENKRSSVIREDGGSEFAQFIIRTW